MHIWEEISTNDVGKFVLREGRKIRRQHHKHIKSSSSSESYLAATNFDCRFDTMQRHESGYEIL